MRKKTNDEKPKTLEDVFDETSTWGDVFYKPPVLWSVLACICALGTVLIAQTDLGQQQIAANFGGASTVQFAKSNSTSQPYSVELALLQNELDRTKNEMRTTLAARQNLEQKLAALENKFDDFATGSLGDTKPIPPKNMKMSNAKAVEPVVADHKALDVTYKDLPKLEQITATETPIAPKIAKSAPVQTPPKVEISTSAMPETTTQIASVAPQQLAIKPGAISQNMPAEKQIADTPPQDQLQKSANSGVPTPNAKPNTQMAAKIDADATKPNSTIQNSNEQMADAKKKLAQDLAKELFKESKAPNDMAAIGKPANDNDLGLLTGSLEPNKKIDIAQPTRSLFAVKLGTEKSMADVNTKWKTTLKNNADVLAGLEPYVHFEEKPKKPIQMNLTVGPFRNTSEATTVCGQLSAAGTPCSVTPFVGQRLLP